MHASQALKIELFFKKGGKTNNIQLCFLCLGTAQARKELYS